MASYFEQALQNFLSEFTTNGSIKHLVDKGLTLDQIIENMNYPASRSKVARQMYEYMVESKIIIEHIDDNYIQKKYKKIDDIYRQISLFGESNVYFECPFGYMIKNDKAKLNRTVSVLTKREQDYIMGIPWILNKTYHIANMRMIEIAIELMNKTDIKLELYVNKI